MFILEIGLMGKNKVLVNIIIRSLILKDFGKMIFIMDLGFGKKSIKKISQKHLLYETYILVILRKVKDMG